MPSQDASQTTTGRARATIARNLDQAITATGLSNREIGDQIGKTEHQVWRWRTGRHTPTLDTLTALADLLFEGDLSRFYTDPDDEPVAA